MFRRLRKSKAQSTAEYAMIFALVVGAIAGVQIYVQRGIKAKVSDSTDAMTSALNGKTISFDEVGSVTLGSKNQWDPDYIGSEYNTAQYSENTETIAGDGTIVIDKEEASARQGSQEIEAVQP